MRLVHGHKGLSQEPCVVLAIAICALVQAATVRAQDAISPPPGRLLASNCFQCHGPTKTSPGFDKVTGKSAGKLYSKLKEFQSGGEGETIMAYHARGYTDRQLRELAQWLSTQP
jgi:cytochrome c553